MNCEELLTALGEYVDGEQQSAASLAVQEHLAQCNPCQVVVDNIRQTISLFRAGEAIPLPQEMHGRLWQAIQRRWTDRFPRGMSPFAPRK